MMRQMELQNFPEFFVPAPPPNKLKNSNKIDHFDGQYDFLSNEFLCEIYFENILYKSVVFAYQAAKSNDLDTQQRISASQTMEELQQISATIQEPIDFFSRRLRVMEGLLRDKFRRNKELKEKLLMTENRELINSQKELSSDNIFYGVVQGNGQNYLGKLLEQIRFDIVNNIDLDRWIRKSFIPEINSELLPRIILKVTKESQIVETIILEKKPIYVLGSLTENDVYMAHISISRIQGVILVDKALGICIIDVGSKGGTFVDGQRIKEHWPVRIKTGSLLNFAVSTRSYSVKIDDTHEKEIIEIKKKLEIDKKAKQELGTLLKKIQIPNKFQLAQEQKQERKPIYFKQIDLDDQFVIQQFNNEVSGDNNSDLLIIEQKDDKKEIVQKKKETKEIKNKKPQDNRTRENQKSRKRSQDHGRTQIKIEYRSSSRHHYHQSDQKQKKKYQSSRLTKRDNKTYNYRSKKRQSDYKSKRIDNRRDRRRRNKRSYSRSKSERKHSRSRTRRRQNRSRSRRISQERSHYKRHSPRNYSNYYQDYYFKTKQSDEKDRKRKQKEKKEKCVVKEKDKTKWLKQIDNLKEKIKKNNELKELEKKKEELKAKIIEKQNKKIVNQV